jgi:hypothetical protein
MKQARGKKLFQKLKFWNSFLILEIFLIRGQAHTREPLAVRGSFRAKKRHCLEKFGFFGGIFAWNLKNPRILGRLY